MTASVTIGSVFRCGCPAGSFQLFVGASWLANPAGLPGDSFLFTVVGWAQDVPNSLSSMARQSPKFRQLGAPASSPARQSCRVFIVIQRLMVLCFSHDLETAEQWRYNKMARNQVFISYSHRDKEFFEELLVHLKPWRDRCLHDIWTDQDIQPSQDWHREIQKAVDSTAVAVLLTSHYFMASDYIRDQEIPPFLQAREEGKLALACLHLRPQSGPACLYGIDGQWRSPTDQAEQVPKSQRSRKYRLRVSPNPTRRPV